ncbi:TonB-dependent receptor plug domain-containing protein [Qipengyuania nanhaisediminis]|uniref:TonB-dependent receptor plug domain-containing protein n=1 Tax=Qipengyuania nanhaisediminis TaxID=604088 RepID=UPI0038B33F8F
MKIFAYLSASTAIAALACAAPGWAQDGHKNSEDDGEAIVFTDMLVDPIVVIASRSPRAMSSATAPVTAVVTEPEIARERQAREVGDLLRDIPSVAVSSVAGQTQIRLRGSEANHVLVLVDGIEVSDPFAGEFDIGTLQSEIGSRGEIILGPQSALYGSDAIGGVLSYFGADGCGAPFEGYAEAGTNATFNASARTGLCEEWGALNLSVTHLSTDGEPNARGGTRDIGRDATTFSANLALYPTETLTLRAVGRHMITKGDFNDQDFDPTSPTFGLVIDSPETRFENTATYALLGAELESENGRWVNDASFQVADIARDSFGPFGRTFGHEGGRLKASFVSSFSLDDASFDHSLTFAADWEEERFRNTDPNGFAFTGRRENDNVGLVGEYRLKRETFALSAALRHDLNGNFADATTFRLAGALDIADETRLRGAIGSAIKNPGFYELFGFVDGRFIGNAGLTPEKSTGWEIGIDRQWLGGAVTASLVYFESELDDEIVTRFPAPTFVATPVNREEVSTRRGIEAHLIADLGAGFDLVARYTRLDAEEDGVTEVRRPRDNAAATLGWTAPSGSWQAAIAVSHNGEAEDLAFTDPSFVPVRVTLEDYTLINLYAEADLGDAISLFARAENLLDSRYEPVFSFVAPGRRVIAGVRLSL